jgi:ATP-binding cassette subfamily C protein
MQIRYLVSRIWKDQPLRFFLSVFTLTIAGLLEGVGVAAIVPMLQVAQSGGSADASTGTIGRAIVALLGAFHLPLNLATALAVVLAAILASEAAVLVQQKLLAGSSELFQAELRKRLFAAVTDASWPYFVRTKTADLISALISATDRAGAAYVTLVQILGAVIMVAVYVCLTLVLSWQMTLAVIVTSTAVMLLLRSRANRGTKYGQDVTKVDAEIQSETQENLSAAKLVKASSSEAAVQRRFDSLTGERQRVRYRNVMNQAWLKTLYETASIITIFVGIYVAITSFGMTVATLTVFLFAYYRLSPRISTLQANQSLLLSLVPALKRVDEYTADAAAHPEVSGARSLEPLSDAIRFESVSFGYGSDHPVLRDVTLAIPAGGSTAIVGASGAGKTTAIDLIMGLLLPASGDVCIDGASLRDVSLSDWRRQIGYVPQDASFFHATVADNIAWSLEGASRDDIVTAATLADADEFIRQFPQGYDTVIGDRGMRMSGGQRQRLGLARALVRKPSILILDEATSALDAESEEKVQAAVERLTGSLTVLIVTHRLATVRGCGLIHVLEGGRLIESGSWDELLVNKGKFAELVALQTLEPQA